MEDIVLISIPEATIERLVERAVYKALMEFNDKKPDEQVDKLLSRRDAAKMLGISLPTLHEWTRSGQLKGYRIGSSIRYKKLEVENSLRIIRQ